MRNATRKEIRQSRILLQNPYAFLDGNGDYAAAPVVSENHFAPDEAPRRTSSREPKPLPHDLAQTPLRLTLIEQKAVALQRDIWLNGEGQWKRDILSNPVAALDPGMALGYLGYRYELVETLGQYSKGERPFEVAGIIDTRKKHVRISNQFPPDTQRFTAAHELGHAVLGHLGGLHRDKPLNGISRGNPRDNKEYDADKFATFFLMPAKLVRDRFSRAFGVELFQLDDATCFALSPGNSDKLLQQLSSRREMSRFLANAEYFNGRRFACLADQFLVSREAMAIRLEELDIVPL